MSDWIEQAAAALGVDPIDDDSQERLLGAARDVAHGVENASSRRSRTYLLGAAVQRRVAAGEDQLGRLRGRGCRPRTRDRRRSRRVAPAPHDTSVARDRIGCFRPPHCGTATSGGVFHAQNHVEGSHLLRPRDDPVAVYPATEEKTLRFNQLHDEDGGRIRYKRVCAIDGEEVPFDHIVKGYEYEKDHYVILTDEDFDAVPVESSRAIDIQQFVDLDEIDPVHFKKSYYLVPEETGAKAYALLREAMSQDRQGRHRQGQLPRQGAPRRASVQGRRLRPGDDVLARRDPRGGLRRTSTSTSKSGEQELEMARQLIENLTADWDPEEFTDEYREARSEIVEAKINGEEIEVVERRAHGQGRRPDGGAEGERRGREEGARRRSPPRRSRRPRRSAREEDRRQEDDREEGDGAEEGRRGVNRSAGRVHLAAGTRDDIETIVAPVRRRSIGTTKGSSSPSAAHIEDDWANPLFDAAQDTLMVAADTGELAGYASAWGIDPRPPWRHGSTSTRNTAVGDSARGSSAGQRLGRAATSPTRDSTLLRPRRFLVRPRAGAFRESRVSARPHVLAHGATARRPERPDRPRRVDQAVPRRRRAAPASCPRSIVRGSLRLRADGLRRVGSGDAQGALRRTSHSSSSPSGDGEPVGALTTAIDEEEPWVGRVGRARGPSWGRDRPGAPSEGVRRAGRPGLDAREAQRGRRESLRSDPALRERRDDAGRSWHVYEKRIVAD